MNNQTVLLVDVFCKYLVLFACTGILGGCVYYKLDPPGWMVSTITMVFIYFFRKSPSKDNK